MLSDGKPSAGLQRGVAGSSEGSGDDTQGLQLLATQRPVPGHVGTAGTSVEWLFTTLP